MRRSQLLLLAFICAASLENASAKSIALGPLKTPGEGCGCAFQSKDIKAVYAWSELGEFATSESIQVNVDGKDLVLSKKASDFPDSKRNPQRPEPRKGERLKEVFEGQGLKAVFNYVFKGPCADLKEKVGEGCEYNVYEIEMNVSRATESASAKLTGGCGC